MVKHRYRKKKTLSNKKVAAAYQKLLHPRKSISAKLMFQADSNSLHEIGDDNEVETEVNTGYYGQLIVIDGGNDVIVGGDDKALHIQVAGEASHAQKNILMVRSLIFGIYCVNWKMIWIRSLSRSRLRKHTSLVRRMTGMNRSRNKKTNQLLRGFGSTAMG